MKRSLKVGDSQSRYTERHCKVECLKKLDIYIQISCSLFSSSSSSSLKLDYLNFNKIVFETSYFFYMYVFRSFPLPCSSPPNGLNVPFTLFLQNILSFDFSDSYTPSLELWLFIVFFMAHISEINKNRKGQLGQISGNQKTKQNGMNNSRYGMSGNFRERERESL